ncbi:MAG: Grx4 family monothiol glutaredoxin [Proteobacteria bacterium]|nr:Grx4 family monothiol glutaredoxin [Pseudomonadota bacterium]MDE3207811.1 Grx4 family monothiol glutaredoxin [Pseudomonadota bacterium]
MRESCQPSLTPGEILAKVQHAKQGNLSYRDNELTLKKQESQLDIQEVIKNQINSHPVVLYMKGTPQMPQCGFSASAVQLLSACGLKNVLAVDVMVDPAIRQGIKEYSNWPTIPQLYVQGEFVGGADIMRQLFDSGELQKMIQATQVQTT